MGPDDTAADRQRCPFCGRNAAQDGGTARRQLAASFPDRYPLSDGHTLVVPVRHVTTLDELDADEFTAMWRLVHDELRRLRRERSPDGFTVGANVGEAAGQTVDHAHVHVVPRYRGDVPDPRGGIRWVLPDRAAWWDAR